MGAPSGENVSASLPDSPKSRSFFSRFLRTRTRNLADFHVRATDPHRKYAAGDHVKGAVVLTVLKPIGVTHLTVTLHGYVRVYKGPNAAGNEPVLNPSEATDGRSRVKYLGNGHASLFQDEQVLVGSGRLDAGRYEFNFDLLFPETGLPSSIDFERGTISYMITATLTRPTAISPTSSCEQKISLVETIDVGPLGLPRPRTISLEPISKKARRRRAGPAEKSSAASDTADAPSDRDSVRAAGASANGSGHNLDNGPQEAQQNARSPIASDMHSVSGESALSGGSTGLSMSNIDPNGAPSVAASQSLAGRMPILEERTITATIECLKGGCLPGDVIPIRVFIQHIKRIKSMHGVIVTLYRQGRIDSAPPIKSFTDLSKEDVRRLTREEYYPKSKTGLGGLSLSAAGSCSVFRKDLSQSVNPLLIDPSTLSATITASVRVPEDAFPTIKGVPGEMIAFKYNLEVLVDLGGKLSNLIQGTGQRQGGGPPATATSPYEMHGGVLATWGGSILDTDPLRREKGVIPVTFEVIVGTLDSGRAKKDRLGPRRSASVYTQQLLQDETFDDDGGFGEEGTGREPYGRHNESPYPYEDRPHGGDAPPREPGQQAPHYEARAGWTPPQLWIPPPQLPHVSELSEKERIRRAEQVLLPSAPDTAGPSTAVAVQENIYDAGDETPSAPAYIPSTPQQDGMPDPGEGPSAPTLDDLSGGVDAESADDKQELERRRLLAEASAPPEMPDDDEQPARGESPQPGGSGSGSGSGSNANLEPSAPVMGEEDEYGNNFPYGALAVSSSHAPSAPSAEPLPRYER